MVTGGGITQPPDSSGWNPTTFLRYEEGLDTSMGTARVVTDAGVAYLKGLGNRQGPHPLACELVATKLAAWFGLPTFLHALIEIDADVDEIPFQRGGNVVSGPAFVTSAAIGHPWGGSEEELAELVNPQDVGKLVVFDTWVSNCDRFPPDLTTRRPNYDNVFLDDLTGDDAGKTRLIAMDHTHCFTCGRDLDDSLTHIGRVKDDRLYGLFPAFKPLVHQQDVEAAIDRLGQVTLDVVRPIVDVIPTEWEVDAGARDKLVDLIVQRAAFVADTVLETVGKQCWPNRLFDNR